MRLTLRTLLAYLDDVLDAQHTREIGKKLQESEYAANLVDRIKKVTRQRRLLAPDVEPNDNHLDANQVAEYLDNILTPEEITAVEKACLESDVQLAEVAASHQVLTLILGEPVDIAPETRNRMYKIVPQSSAPTSFATENGESGSEKPFLEVTKSSGEFRLPPPTETEPTGTALDQGEPSFKEELPEYLRNQSSSRSRLPLIIFSSAIVLFLVLLVVDPDLRRFLFPVSDNAVTADAETDGAEGDVDAGEEELGADADDIAVGADVAMTDEPLRDDGVAEPATGEADTGTDNVVDSGVGDVEDAPVLPLDDETELAANTPDAKPAMTNEPVAPAAEPVVNEGEEEATSPAPAPAPVEVAAVVPPVPMDDTPAETKPPEPSVPAIPPARILYTMQEGIVVQYQEAKSEWFPMPHRSVIHPNDEFASPLPFDATFNVDQGSAQFTLIAGTRVKNLPPSEVAPFGLELQRGALRIEAGPELQNEANLPFPLAIKASDVTWRLELMTADTRFGIEVLPRLPYEIPIDAKSDNYKGMIYVQQGTVRFADGNGRVEVVNANQALSLNPADLRNSVPPIALATAENAAEDSPGLPGWVSNEETRESVAVRKAKLSYEKLFATNQSLEQSMSPHILNKNPIVASWAVDSLGHAGDIHSLVLALSTPDQPLEVVEMARQHLREWLIQDPEANNMELQAELEAAFAPDDRPVVMQLLWGITPDEARDPDISQQVVSWMDHELLAVRAMAIELAAYYTGRELHYRPDASAKNRQPMLLRWKSYLEKNKGRLVL